MSGLSINASLSGDSLQANNQIQQKNQQLKMLESLKELGNKSQGALQTNLISDIQDLAKSIESTLKNTQYSHQSFMELSQRTVEFFTMHEHEALFEQFEELNDFAKKRKKKPSLTQFITSQIQHVGIWNLNTNATATNTVNSADKSSSTNLQSKGQERKFSGLIDEHATDDQKTAFDVQGCELTYIPTNMLTTHDKSNEGMIFSVSKEVSFESFASISKSSEKLPLPDIEHAGIPNMDSLSLSVDEIYDAIVAILNKVILTEDDLFILMQLIGEGGIKLVGFMPQNMLQEIVSTIEESVKDIANQASSIENILVLLAKIQQFSSSDIGQLIDMPLFDDSQSKKKNVLATNAFPVNSVPITPLYTDNNNNISTTDIQDNLPLSTEPDSTDEQLAGAQSYQKNSQQIANSTHDENSISPEAVSSVNQIGQSMLELSSSKQNEFVNKMLDTLLKVMHHEVESIVTSSLNAMDDSNSNSSNSFF